MFVLASLPKLVDREEKQLKVKMPIVAFLIFAVLSLFALTRIALFQRNERSGQKNNADELVGLAVVTELIKTHYRVGERILVNQRLVNLADQPLTVWGDDKLLFLKVYDEGKRVVRSKLPGPRMAQPVDQKLNLDGVHRGGSWTEHFTFALDQPGRYKVVAWAELSLAQNWDDPRIIYSEPVWLEIVTGRGVEFRSVEWGKDPAIPQEVRRWVENSLKFDVGYFANAKEFDGKQYLFIRSGFKTEHLVKIATVSVLEQTEVQVEVEIGKSSLARQTTPADHYDLVYIKATGLPVRFVPMTSEFALIASLSGIHYLPDIVAQSGSIKLFGPAPGKVVGRRFSVSGVASVFEGTVNYRLLDANQDSLYSGFITAGQLAPGFAGDPVVVDDWLGVADWRYFTFDLEVVRSVAEGESLTLELFWVSPLDGAEKDIISISVEAKPY